MTDRKTLCIDKVKDGKISCKNRSHKTTAGLACTKCSLDEYGVENHPVSRPPGRWKRIFPSILTWAMVPKHVAKEDAEKHRTALSDKCRYHNLV